MLVLLVTLSLMLPAYMLGSIPFALLLSRLFGLPDPRTYGSQNPGATNVLRTGNRLAAALTLIGDSCKGLVAVLLSKFLLATLPWLADANLQSAAPVILAWVALAAFMGHVFPVFLKFRGGKGVATAFGVAWAGYWPLGLLMSLVWLGMAALFRYSSLAAITAAVITTGVVVMQYPSLAVQLPVLLGCALLLFRHQKNIQKLLRGEEKKIGG